MQLLKPFLTIKLITTKQHLKNKGKAIVTISHKYKYYMKVNNYVPILN